MERAKQFSVSLPNKKGQMAALSRCLADAKVNIRALSVLESTEVGTVRMVVDKPDEAAAALKEAGMHYTTTEVLVAAMPNKVGVLAEAAEKLADSGVNIHFAYGSTGKGRGAAHIVIGCDKKPTAEKVLADF
jgi:hypothetical protein